MSFPVSATKRTRLVRIGRVLLGAVVGASFGVVIGALIASWVWGVAAIEGEAVRASYLAGGITVAGTLAGAAIGYRVGRTDVAEPPTNSEPAARRH